MIERLMVYLFYLLTFSLVFSRFLSDFIVSLSGIIFFFLIIKKKLDFNLYLNHKIVLFFFIWCQFLILISLFSDNILLSLESSLFYFRFGLFVLIFSYLANNYNNFLKNFCLSFLFIIVALLADSLLQYINGQNIFGYDHNGTKVSSFFKDEEILGSFVSRTYLLPVIAFLLMNFRLKYQNELFFLYLFLTFFIIYISGERTAFFIFLLNIIILTFSYRKFFKKNIKYFLIISIMVSTSLLLEHKQFKRMIIDTYYSFDFKIKNSSIESFKIFSSLHNLHYITAYKMFKDSPIIGHGPKVFRDLCKSEKYDMGYYINDPNKNDQKIWLNINCTTHPHNTYLQLLAETGIIGFSVIFFIFLICSIMIIKKIFNINFKINDVSYLCYVMIFCNLWPFMPSGNFFNNWLTIIYFIPISILFYNLITNKQ